MINSEQIQQAISEESQNHAKPSRVFVRVYNAVGEFVRQYPQGWRNYDVQVYAKKLMEAPADQFLNAMRDLENAMGVAEEEIVLLLEAQENKPQIPLSIESLKQARQRAINLRSRLTRQIAEYDEQIKALK